MQKRNDLSDVKKGMIIDFRTKDEAFPKRFCKMFACYRDKRFVEKFVTAEAEWYGYRIVACLVTSSSLVLLKTCRAGQRYTLNLSRAETSSLWCGVEVRRGRCQLRCRPRHLTMVQNYVVLRQKP
ncbi:uncharacterized protein TNCV_930831 [Trichonephila clavipes]|uniref:Uncharacterized protein n=1 Tax=Trichonephila clavipes TaxID=2585209 RepID=A0A8X7BDY6_TRICX|nr:uncharacterized protein TNCV_930831 [Trichonephila clavipes]